MLVLYAWLIMFFNAEEGMLTSKGFTNLKYYTTLSNIFAAVVALMWVSDYVKKKDASYMPALKLVAAAAVGVTFLVVLGFLGPLYGFQTMYKRSNFFLHLVVPIMAMAEMIFFNDMKISLRQSIATIIPPLIYGTVYLINCIINGIEGNDIYAFLRWGYPVGLLIFAIICLVSFIIGTILRIIGSELILKRHITGDTV